MIQLEQTTEEHPSPAEIRMNKPAKKRAPKQALQIEMFDGYAALDRPVQKTCDKLAVLSVEALEAMNEALSKYVKIVMFIRESQLTPDLVRKTLDAQGFNEARISEICRIAYGPEDVLEQLKQNVIGFKAAVQMVRDKTRTKEATLTLRLNKATKPLVKLAEELGSLDEVVGPWRIQVTKNDNKNT